MLNCVVEGGGRSSLLLLLLFLGVFSCAAAGVVGHPVTSRQTAEEAAAAAADAVRSVLRGLHRDGPNCSVVLLVDHSATAAALVKGLPAGYAAGGTALLQLPSHLSVQDEYVNNTEALDHHIKELMVMGRQLRYVTRCITMVFATDSPSTLGAMLQHTTDDRLMLWSTNGIIVTSLSKASALKVAENKWAFTMLNTLLLLLRRSPSGENSALVVRHEPYSPVGRRTLPVGFYTPTNGLAHSQPLEYEKFNNFFGGDVNFTTLPYLPFSEVKEITLPNGTKTFEFSGADVEILNAISKVLNFTSTFVQVQTWRQIELEVIHRNSFIVVCQYYLMLTRWVQYDYINAYTTKDLAFTMRRPEGGSTWDSFVRPFYLEVWVLILVVLCILAVCLILVLKFSMVENVISTKIRGGQQFFGAVHEITKTRAVIELFGALLGQDFTFRMPNTHSFRILLTAWFLFMIVLSTGYKSNLISFMTIPKLPTRVETVAQLVKSNVRMTTPPWGKDHQKTLKASSSSDHNAIAARSSVVASLTGLKMAITHGTAHLESRRFQSFTIADQFTRSDGTSDYYIGKENIISLLASLPIPHDAPFRQQFARVMDEVFQAGLYKKWHDIEIEKLRISKAEAAPKNADGTPVRITSENSPVKPLTVSQLQGPFWIALCGNGIAVLAFLAEKISAKLTKTMRATRSNKQETP